jgi:hypothetical protein
MDEIVSIGTNSAVLALGGEIVHLQGLQPDTQSSASGLHFRTLKSAGALLSRVVTMNDVHFGETKCGEIEGITGAALEVEPGEEPYPMTMNRSVCDDANELQPDAVIVKGDLTNSGKPEEFQAFLDCYVGTFGDKVAFVRGNHDSYHAEGFADTSVQIIDNRPEARRISGEEMFLDSKAKSLREINWLAHRYHRPTEEVVSDKWYDQGVLASIKASTRSALRSTSGALAAVQPTSAIRPTWRSRNRAACSRMAVRPRPASRSNDSHSLICCWSRTRSQRYRNIALVPHSSAMSSSK